MPTAMLILRSKTGLREVTAKEVCTECELKLDNFEVEKLSDRSYLKGECDLCETPKP